MQQQRENVGRQGWNLNLAILTYLIIITYECVWSSWWASWLSIQAAALNRHEHKNMRPVLRFFLCSWRASASSETNNRTIFHLVWPILYLWANMSSVGAHIAIQIKSPIPVAPNQRSRRHVIWSVFSCSTSFAGPLDILHCVFFSVIVRFLA